MAENVGVPEAVPRKTSLQKYRTNTPSESPKEHYKKTGAIPLLDSLCSHIEERFSGEGCHARGLLCLVPAIILCYEMVLLDNTESMCYVLGKRPSISKIIGK